MTLIDRLREVDEALAEYEQVRSDGACFVVLPGHDLPEVERVVERNGRFLVVEKFGAAAAIARGGRPSLPRVALRRQPLRPSSTSPSGFIVDRFVFGLGNGWNETMDAMPGVIASLTVPRRLLLLSAIGYAVVFVLLREYGRPGLGISQGFYVPVILLAAATGSPLIGALGGVLALFLWEVAIHHHTVLAWHGFTQGPALTRLVSYVAAGALTGFLALRSRRMLKESFHVLDEVIELAYTRIETPADDVSQGGRSVTVAE